MRVVPEKADGRSHHGAAEDSHFGNLRHFRELKIIRENSMSADVSEHGQRAGGDHRAADGQSVQAVSEIHRVAGSDNNNGHKSDERQESYRPQIAVVPLAD